MKISVSDDGQEFIIRVPRQEFTNLNGLPVTQLLSFRRQQVLKLVAEGKCNKDIGAQLCISESTVKFHVSALLLYFNVSNRRELMVVVASNRLKEVSVH